MRSDAAPPERGSWPNCGPGWQTSRAAPRWHGRGRGLIALAGGEALVTRPGQHAPTLDRDALAALDPELVLVKPCGFPLQRTVEELGVLREALPSAWRARVFLADGNAFFNRPGPRIVESLEILAACVHPELFEDFAAKHVASFRAAYG